jgi:hypothetical protein
LRAIPRSGSASRCPRQSDRPADDPVPVHATDDRHRPQPEHLTGTASPRGESSILTDRPRLCKPAIGRRLGGRVFAPSVNSLSGGGRAGIGAERVVPRSFCSGSQVHYTRRSWAWMAVPQMETTSGNDRQGVRKLMIIYDSFVR